MAWWEELAPEDLHSAPSSALDVVHLEQPWALQSLRPLAVRAASYSCLLFSPQGVCGGDSKGSPALWSLIGTLTSQAENSELKMYFKDLLISVQLK